MRHKNDYQRYEGTQQHYQKEHNFTARPPDGATDCGDRADNPQKPVVREHKRPLTCTQSLFGVERKQGGPETANAETEIVDGVFHYEPDTQCAVCPVAVHYPWLFRHFIE